MAAPEPRARPLRVHLVAGEESGDQLGAALMRAIRQRRPETSFSGLGGAAMRAEGLASAFDIKELGIVGVAEILRRLPSLLRRIRDTADAAVAARPDVLVIIDSPEFTHRVAARVRAALPTLPILDYVSPSVWAWRPWRARTMRAYVDRVLALLPFEPDVHRRLGGPPCTYVGHPLAERVAALRPDDSERRRREADPPVVLVLPGSRRGEIRRLMRPFGGALAMAAERAGPFDPVLPTLPHLLDEVTAAAADWPVRPRIVAGAAAKEQAFRTARAALAASGTVTLELALSGVPTVAAYRLSMPEALIARGLIQVPSVILGNLVLGENVVPEYLQRRCTPAALGAALAALIGDSPERRRQLEAFERIDEIMQVGVLNPSQEAAELVLSAVQPRIANIAPQ